MSSVQIPNMTAAISLNGTEQLEAVQAGSTVRITSAQIASLASLGVVSFPLPVAMGGTGGAAASGTLLDNITGFSSTGFINRTGSGTYTFTSGLGSGSVILSAGGLAVTTGKTLTVSNTLTLVGTDSSTLNVGAGGTLTALAFQSPGTGVATALSVNVGSAGAIVVNGGVLGTPSSGVATNLTGLPLTTGVVGALAGANGGTGVANTSKTITLAGNLVTTGAFNTTLAQAATTTITLPATSSTMARTDAAQTFTGTQTFGALVATTVNGLAVTTSTGTLTVANGKTLTVSRTLTLTGTDSTTMTFPSTSATIARTDAAQTFTGNQTFTNVVTVSGGTATPAAGSTSARLLFGTTAGFGIYYGSGAPTVSAAQGSLYLRSDGSTTTSRTYVNTDGSTTWTAITTVA